MIGLSLSLTTVGGVGSDSGFDPLAFGTPILWASGRSGITHGAGIVTAIDDLSPVDNDPIITSGQEPSYNATDADYGNNPTFEFPASDTKRVTIAGHGLTTGPVTFVLVGHCENTIGYMMSTSAGPPFIKHSGGQIFASGDGSSTDLITGDDEVPSVLIFVCNGASSKLYVSNKTPVTGNSGPFDFTGLTLWLGNYGAGVNALFTQEGPTAEFMIFNGALSQGDCEALLDGFGAIHGITITP
jgi:hypothetical protein